MNQFEYSTVYEALKAIPDPRAARGQRHDWGLILLLIVAALASGQRNGRAIGQWVSERQAELIEKLKPQRGNLPSPSTLRRGLQRIDLVALEQSVAALVTAPQSDVAPGLSPPPAVGKHVALAADGKWLRGTQEQGQTQKTAALVVHTSGTVVAQRAIAPGSSEQATVAALLAQCDLRQTVVTLDALHTTPALAHQLVEQGADYFMSVKRNQPTLRAAIELLFQQPPWQARGAAPESAQCTATSKGHGRLERRTVQTSSALDDYFSWPHARQVVCRTSRRINLTTGEIVEERQYAITSLAPAAASPAQLAALWRGHWTIENRTHYVRDVSFGEDRCRIRRGHAAHALTALRNLIIALFRHAGWRYMPDALRHFAAYPDRVLRFLGAIP